MGVFRSIAGMVRLELTSADIPGALAMLAERNIPVFGAETDGELTITFLLRREDHRKAAEICEKRGDRLRFAGQKGIYWSVKGLLKRPVLTIGLLAMLVTAMYLPSRVLFLRVEGNYAVPTNLILAAAEDSGIRFGASRREVRSERVKNALLEAVPQLQWAGVNTYGCVAVITVRERSVTEELAQERKVSSIVASTDGVVLSATATSGSLLCKPGQAVTEGEVLISGYTDCGLTIEAACAEGEVYARTMHEIAVCTPLKYVQRQGITDAQVDYSLLIGKKRINLWKDSGISDTSCGRMYEEYYITLPGGFTLPLVLVKETVTFYETATAELDAGDVQEGLEEFASRYVLEQMIAGSIDDRVFWVGRMDGVLQLNGSFLCTEMIGRQRVEQIGDLHE